MSVFQIWGSFLSDEHEYPTTISTFRKGSVTTDGKTTLEMLERDFAKMDGEELVLLHEFDPIQQLTSRGIDEHLPSKTMENALAFMIADAFMEGWWRRKDDDATDDQEQPEAP